MRKLFIVGGTWEYSQFGIQQDIVSNLHDNWEVEWISYPARFGDGDSFNNSSRTGSINLANAIERWNGEYAITGFSQGAKIAGDVARRFHSDQNLQRVYCIADPFRSSQDRFVGPFVKGQGIGGQREIGWKATHIVAPGDFIAANNNPFISNVARYTFNMNNKDPMNWIKSFSAAAKTREKGSNVLRGFKELTYYLKSQVHTNYDKYEVQPGLTAMKWIAQDLNRWN